MYKGFFLVVTTNNGEENMGMEILRPDRFCMHGSRPFFPFLLGIVHLVRQWDEDTGTGTGRNELGWDPGVHANRIRN